MNNSENIQKKWTGDEIMNLVRFDKISDAVNILLDLNIVKKNHELKSTIVALDSRNNHNEKNKILGIISEENAKLERNRIVIGLLAIIKDIEIGKIKMPKILIVNFSHEANFINQLHELKNELIEIYDNNRFSIEIITVSDLSEFEQKLEDIKPNILHIVGDCHEEDIEKMVINGSFFCKSDFANIFKPYKDIIKCVFLDTFYSEPLAELIKKHISIVIGLRIHDDVAFKFARTFYHSFAKGDWISVSLDNAIKSVCGCVEKEHALDVEN